jgi:hypothetical protein
MTNEIILHDEDIEQMKKVGYIKSEVQIKTKLYKSRQEVKLVYKGR